MEPGSLRPGIIRNDTDSPGDVLIDLDALHRVSSQFIVLSQVIERLTTKNIALMFTSDGLIDFLPFGRIQIGVPAPSDHAFYFFLQEALSCRQRNFLFLPCQA